MQKAVLGKLIGISHHPINEAELICDIKAQSRSMDLPHQHRVALVEKDMNPRMPSPVEPPKQSRFCSMRIWKWRNKRFRCQFWFSAPWVSLQTPTGPTSDCSYMSHPAGQLIDQGNPGRPSETRRMISYACHYAWQSVKELMARLPLACAIPSGMT